MRGNKDQSGWRQSSSINSDLSTNTEGATGGPRTQNDRIQSVNSPRKNISARSDDSGYENAIRTNEQSPSSPAKNTTNTSEIKQSSIQDENVNYFSKLSLEEPKQPTPQSRRGTDFVPYMKPPSCLDKRGNSGDRVTLMANYFEVKNKPNWLLYQYHVDFNPQIDSRRMRQALLHQHNNLFPNNKAFDGSTLYSFTMLPNEVTLIEIQSPIMILLYIIFLFQITYLASVRESDKEEISVKIKYIGKIIPTSPKFVHLFNVVFKRYLFLGIYQDISFEG